MKDDAGPKAWRGTATEFGLKSLLFGATIEEATALALVEFDKLCLGEISDDITKQRGLIPDFVAQANQWQLANKFELAATQLFIETWIPGISIPFHGYIDFTFMNAPDTDLKTTERLELKRDHVRQIAIYNQGRGTAQSLLYVTPKKYQHFVIPEDELASALKEVRSAALSLERFLDRVDDAQDALHLLPLNTDHWKMNETLIEAHAQLLGA
ncbi:MAG TPA: hypothetical protein VFA65_24555 [Bryobacteraceae bacterium]|nr:hypothetical protein [Bryobacteraceae bacterium]